MEGPREVIGGNFPRCCAGGEGFAGLGVVLDEALEEGLDEIKIGLDVDDLRVEVGGLGEIAEVEDLVAFLGTLSAIVEPESARK